jgi:hypothetical protein
LVKNTGVAEADVVPGGWSHRGAAASGGGLVLTVADEQEHGLGGEIVPDLNVQPMAEDPLVCAILSTPQLICPYLMVIRVRSNRRTDESYMNCDKGLITVDQMDLADCPMVCVCWQGFFLIWFDIRVHS